MKRRLLLGAIAFATESSTRVSRTGRSSGVRPGFPTGPACIGHSGLESGLDLQIELSSDSFRRPLPGPARPGERRQR